MIVLLILVNEAIQRELHFQLQRQLIIQPLGLVLHQQHKHVLIHVQVERCVMEQIDVGQKGMDLAIFLSHMDVEKMEIQ